MKRLQKGKAKKVIHLTSERPSTEVSERGRILMKGPRNHSERSIAFVSLLWVIWPTVPGSHTQEPVPIVCLSIKPTQKHKPSASPEEYERDRVNKYAKHFRGNALLSIHNVTIQLETRTVSFIIMDLRSKRLASLKKKAFLELLRSFRAPCWYYSRQSYATWDIQLPTETEAKKYAAKNIVIKF